jgi:hypothetical protein
LRLILCGSLLAQFTGVDLTRYRIYVNLSSLLKGILYCCNTLLTENSNRSSFDPNNDNEKNYDNNNAKKEKI